MRSAVREKTAVEVRISEALRRLDGDPEIQGDREGGGLALAGLLQPMFETLLDDGYVPTQQFTQIAKRTHAFKKARIEYIWRNYHGDPYEGLIDDVCLVLSQTGFLDPTDQGWRLGPEFAVGRHVQLTQGVGVTIHPQETRERLNFYTKEQANLSALVAGLALDQERTLRKIDPKRVEALAESMRVHGFMAAFPIVLDQHGRLLSGWHRKAAAERIGIDWRRERAPNGLPFTVTVNVESDSEALAIAYYGNAVLSWTHDDLDRLGRRLYGASERLSVDLIHRLNSQQGKRDRAEMELLIDAGRSDHDIARMVGCGHPLVGEVRRELEENGRIFRFLPERGRGKTRRETVAEKPSAHENPKRAEQRQRDERVLQRVEAGQTQAEAAVAEGYSRKTATNVVIRARAARADRQPDQPANGSIVPQTRDEPIACRHRWACTSCGEIKAD